MPQRCLAQALCALIIGASLVRTLIFKEVEELRFFVEIDWLAAPIRSGANIYIGIFDVFSYS